jgi:DTW domain-containing protein YfiP
MSQAPRRPRGFRQERCPGCGLTPAWCVCNAFEPLSAGLSVSLVSPPAEQRKTSGTARLLSLWLGSARVHVCGADGLRDPSLLLAREGSSLLFPDGDTEHDVLPQTRHLIVPDGTWRQARRLERRWFRSAPVPRVQLAAGWPSLYRLRRHPEGPCTFEATAIALGLLAQPELGAELLRRFALWARRAEALRRGGGPPDAPPPANGDPHPAVARVWAVAAERARRQTATR